MTQTTKVRQTLIKSMTVLSKEDDDDVHRLTDLKVEEVSIVDRPANLRPFLVVKRDASMGAEIFRDEHGELVTKEKKKPLSDKARAFLESIGVDPDKKKTGDKEDKKKSSYDDEKDADKDVSKAGAKMNKENMADLLQAIEILGKLKGALNPATGPSAGIATSKRADDGMARLEKQLGDLSKQVSGLSAKVSRQSETIQKQKKIISTKDEKLSQTRKSRQNAERQIAAPSAMRAEVGKIKKSNSRTTWPMDLNEENKESEF